MANPCDFIRKKRLTTTAELLIVHIMPEQGANQLHAKAAEQCLCHVERRRMERLLLAGVSHTTISLVTLRYIEGEIIIWIHVAL